MSTTTASIRYLTVKQVAAALNVSRSTLWRWVKGGYFVKPVRLGPKVTRFLESDVLAWAREKTEAQR